MFVGYCFLRCCFSVCGCFSGGFCVGGYFDCATGLYACSLLCGLLVWFGLLLVVLIVLAAWVLVCADLLGWFDLLDVFVL